MPEWTVIIATAVIAASAAWITTWATRRTNLETRMTRSENRNRAQWFYIQQLIQHINGGHPPPAPHPPKAVIDLEDNE
jgi:hypothetical protein